MVSQRWSSARIKRMLGLVAACAPMIAASAALRNAAAIQPSRNDSVEKGEHARLARSGGRPVRQKRLKHTRTTRFVQPALPRVRRGARRNAPGADALPKPTESF